MSNVLAIDLGGTNIRACVYDSVGSAVGETINTPSLGQKGADTTLDAVCSAAQKAIANANSIQRIGLSIPGVVDDDQGIVRWAPNLGQYTNSGFEYWKDIDIRGPLESKLGIPVSMGNDANLAALGEYVYGSGENKASCLVMLTLGTGIGGGVVLSPRSVMGKADGPLLLLGGNKGGVELGHLVIQHGGQSNEAGIYGCLEAYCQAEAIVKRARYHLARDRESIVRDMIHGDIKNLTPKLLAEAADQNDPMSIEVWEETGKYLGVGIASIINAFAPEIVALGGQIAKTGKWLLEPAIESARNSAIPALFKDARIVIAKQTEDAGMLGAAALAFQQSAKR